MSGIARSAPADPWLLYVVECVDGTLYTGITNNLDRRLLQHNQGKACRYTRGRRPVTLCYLETCGSQSAALRRERQIKVLSREEKQRLIGDATNRGR